MENFGRFMAMVLNLIISQIIKGFVLMKLWGWFIVPVFEASPLRLVEAIGLMFMMLYFRFRHKGKISRRDYWDNIKARVISIVFMSAFALLSGWVCQLFM